MLAHRIVEKRCDLVLLLAIITMHHSFFKQLRYKLFEKANYANALSRLGAMERAVPDTAGKISIPFDYEGKGFFKSIRPMQAPSEIRELYRRVRELQPARVLEIGTCHGGTLYLWCKAALPNATIGSIDLPLGHYGGGYPVERAPFYQEFKQPGQSLHLMREDSHADQTRDKVLGVFGGEQPLDFLFIDGDHTYEGVKRDFNLYSPLVRPGGLIALHDIMERPTQPDIEVFRFWDEIRETWHGEAIISDSPDERKIGIGIIVKPSNNHPSW